MPPLFDTRAFYIAVLLVVASAFFLAPVMFSGMPVGHDPGFYHVTYEGFKNSLGDGYLAPRWLGDVNNGFGGANFYFTAPLLFYGLYALDLLTLFSLKTDTLLGVFVFSLLFLSGLSFFECARRWVPASAAFAGAVLYMFLPYHYAIEVFDRFAMAEFATYVFLPLIFHFIDPRRLGKPGGFLCYILCYGGLILTHLPTALLASIFIGLYCGFSFRSFDTTKAHGFYMIKVAALSFLSVCLCAFYLMPALFLQHLVDMDYLWQDFYDYSHWFVTYFPNDSVPNKPFIKGVFLAMALNVGLVCVSYFFLKHDQNVATQHRAHVYIGLLLFACVLMSSLLSFVWSFVTILQAVQFPWRLMVLADFFCAMAFMFIFSRQNNSNSTKIMLSVAVSLAVGFVTFYIQPQQSHATEVFQAKQASILKVKQSTREHVPLSEKRVMRFDNIMQRPTPQFVVAGGADTAEVTVVKRKAQLIDLRINAQNPSTIFVRQFYSPLWELSIVDAPSRLSGTFLLRPAAPYGHIAFDVPAGAHDVSLVIKATPEERYGLVISGLALLILIGLYISAFLPERKKGA